MLTSFEMMKTCFPEAEQESSGNNAAAKDIEDADKEFGINSD